MMRDVLEEIVAYKRIEVEDFKSEMPPRELYGRVEAQIAAEVGGLPSMKESLLSADYGIIAEFKRKSPSKGWIKKDGRAEEIPLNYERNGASAISILTDNRYFGGADSFITEARRSGVTLPVLYKNFVIDEYQLFQARLCGASAVLLIAAAIGLDECRSFLSTAHELGLEVLLELHNECELDYAGLESDMYGVNNRNLGTFVTDVENSFRMAGQLPRNCCKVSESGISAPAIVKSLRLVGFNGFLIGEHFMKSESPGGALKSFIEEIEVMKSRSQRS